MTKAFSTSYKDSVHYFVEEISTSLCCPIHKGLFTKPVIASCGHTFCQSCILEYLDNSEEPECPIDHSSLNESGCLIPNLAVEGQIKDLFVYCKYALKIEDNELVVDTTVSILFLFFMYIFIYFYIKACKTKVRLCNLSEHEENCDFAVVTCKNCKQENIRRRDLEIHNRNCNCCPCPHADAGKKKTKNTNILISQKIIIFFYNNRLFIFWKR